jgi:hypothetical protein
MGEEYQQILHDRAEQGREGCEQEQVCINHRFPMIISNSPSTGFWTIVFDQDAPDDMLVDLDTKRLRENYEFETHTIIFSNKTAWVIVFR